ncbi:hypothetical protein PQO01_17910 [Lentisphaera marina]|uniref:hypothetical protein n=1 Tax=Lentisphaera marina TaxID=1111041 RepID=UPI002365E43E|nr:hypothetical protein [Lentisphaera marina]MDD7986830.1 hypothetical protein [Lentisphaera marina]
MKNIFVIIVFLISSSVYADRELPGVENSRLAFDLSSRSSYWNEANELSLQHFIGIDFYKILTVNGSDFGSLTIQPFINRIDNGYRTPSVYDDDDDWEFLFRTFALNINAWGSDKPYFKIGHFEIPFGGEYNKDTFGDLHQYGQGAKIGMKMDWGFAMGQELENWLYEIAITRGSGMKYRDREDPYAISGRVGSVYDGDFDYGFSFFHGEVLKEKSTIKREIIAVDFEYYMGTKSILIEIHGGQVEDENLLGSLLEFNIKNDSETTELYIQHFYQNLENNTHLSSAAIGINYQMTNQLNLSSQIVKEFESPPDEQEELIEFQVRYRF